MRDETRPVLEPLPDEAPAAPEPATDGDDEP